MKSLRLLRICFAAAVVFFLAVNSAYASRAYPVYSRQGMVVSAEPYATSVGFEILRAGGNAADAAAAVGFALAVTFPSAGNLGGADPTAGFLPLTTAKRPRLRPPGTCS